MWAAIARASPQAPALRAGWPQQVWSAANSTVCPLASSTLTVALPTWGAKPSTRHVTKSWTTIQDRLPIVRARLFGMGSEAAFRSTVEHLATSDVHLGRIVGEHGHPRRFSRPASFQTLVLLVLEQQVSLDSARAAYDRLDALIPGVEAAALVALTDLQLREVGFSRQKTRYARELALRVIDGRLDPAALAALADDDVRAALVAVPGIGPWTADVFLMSSLGRPDVWPVGADADGYLQFIDTEALLALAMEEDLVVRLERRPGDYVVAGCPLALVSPGSRVTDRLTEQVCCLALSP